MGLRAASGRDSATDLRRTRARQPPRPSAHDRRRVRHTGSDRIEGERRLVRAVPAPPNPLVTESISILTSCRASRVRTGTPATGTPPSCVEERSMDDAGPAAVRELAPEPGEARSSVHEPRSRVPSHGGAR
jgi:hypothetical protein